MSSIAQHTPETTRQFLMSMCAQANSQLTSQGLMQNPHTAVLAQANLKLADVLALLRH